MSWDFGAPLLPHQHPPQKEGAQLSLGPCHLFLTQHHVVWTGQWPFVFGQALVLSPWCSSWPVRGRCLSNCSYQALLGSQKWEAGVTDGCRRRKVLGREERKRLLPRRKFKESRGSQETAGLARFPERRPGPALEWRRPERHEEWGLCQLPPPRKSTDRWTDRQTGSAERDAEETCRKSQGRGRYRGRSLCAP